MRVTDDMIDPQLRLRGKLLRRVIHVRSEDDLRRPQRPLVRWLRRPRPVTGAQRFEEWIPRRDGSVLRVVIVKPLRPAPAAAGVLWLHGGGYALGSPDQEAEGIVGLVGATGCVVVAPDYRLSPRAPYPAALEDSYTALRWLRDHAGELGVRDDQLAVAGGSAGGGLTAAVSLLARDEGEISIAFQMPICPMIDDRGATASVVDNDAPVWNAAANEAGWRLYLGELYGGDVPAYAAPARATDLAGLPPTITCVGGVDPLRDETVAYAEGLREAGVPVHFREFPGAWHGFERFAPRAGISREARAWRLEQFRHALDHYFAEQQRP